MKAFHFWDRRIPALYGIGGIVLIIFALTFMVQQRIIFRSNASSSTQPRSVQVTNITDSSFTVTYTTDEKVLGSIQYGLNKNIDQTAFDDRDTPPSSVTERFSHSITIKNVKPSTVYYFGIKSGVDTYLNDAVEYQVATAPQLSEKSKTTIKPLTGKIILPTGEAATDALVLVKTNGQTLSTTTTPTGSYVLSLNTMRSTDLGQFSEIKEGDTAHIKVLNNQGNSDAEFTITTDNIVPVITLTQEFNFKSDISVTPKASPSAQIELLPTKTPVGSSSGTPQIITPQSNQGFIDPKPVFNGTAQPNATVSIEIHSDQPISSTVKANATGGWSFKIPENLTPGLHTITISTKDIHGILRTITQSFTVYAQGSQVNQSATPSATLTPTKVPTKAQTSTPKPTATATPAPTIAAATATPTEIPTLTPTAATTSAPTPTIVPTGSEAILYGGLFGSLLTVMGMTLFLLAGII